MKFIRKIAAVVMAAAMAVTGMAVSASAAGGGSMEEAVKITSGKTYTGDTSVKSEVENYYKISVAEKGTLKITYTSKAKESIVCVFDAYGATVNYAKSNVKAGKVYDKTDKTKIDALPDSGSNSFTGIFTYSVKKGTYYIYIRSAKDVLGSINAYYGGKYSLKVTTPGGDSSGSSETAITYLNIKLNKGDTLSLGIKTTGTGTASWSSSDKSVATVSDKGKVTAKGEGSAVITVKYGSSTVQVQIIVTE